MNTTEKQPKTFTDVINSDTPVLVDFYADWCGPCKMMAPILKNLKKEMGDKLSIIKIDTDRNPDAAAKYKIRGVPTLILFRNGQIIWRQSGVVQLAQLKQIVNQKIQQS